jgi:hypothetical protein
MLKKIKNILPSADDTAIPGANPTIASYNVSVVNFYNATDSLARFENKIFFLYLGTRSSLLQRWRCSRKFKSRRIGSRIF